MTAASSTPPSDPTPVDDDQDLEDLPDEVTIPAPDTHDKLFGGIREAIGIYRQREKRKRLVEKGYVQWYLIDGNWPEPRYVKPELNGRGIPEYVYNGDRYLFPQNAMLPSAPHGIRTVVHKKNEIDPVNLHEPGRNSIPPDVLDEYIDMSLASSPPSWFDTMDIDAQEAMRYLLVGLVGFAILWSFLGGGI